MVLVRKGPSLRCTLSMGPGPVSFGRAVVVANVTASRVSSLQVAEVCRGQAATTCSGTDMVAFPSCPALTDRTRQRYPVALEGRPAAPAAQRRLSILPMRDSGHQPAIMPTAIGPPRGAGRTRVRPNLLR